ncbi:FxsA family protein [Catellatospora paridis]|uniref:FxsA family protein n=1 Tax=Catellatospora paridis TaxID=1617086 RepID=UPI0012D3C0FA|nr:FxsA family protein [Catellatospora paridis]
MRRLRWVPLAVLLLGAVEFAVFWGVSRLIGIGATLLLAIGLMLLGAFLLRKEGLSAWRRLREARLSGQTRGDQAVDGVVGLIAALLLIIPGLLTAAVGLLLLIPPVRRLARGRVRAATEKRIPASAANSVFGPRKVRVSTPHDPHHQPHPPQPPAAGRPGPSEVIEGEIVD